MAFITVGFGSFMKTKAWTRSFRFPATNAGDGTTAHHVEKNLSTCLASHREQFS